MKVGVGLECYGMVVCYRKCMNASLFFMSFSCAITIFSCYSANKIWFWQKPEALPKSSKSKFGGAVVQWGIALLCFYFLSWAATRLLSSRRQIWLHSINSCARGNVSSPSGILPLSTLSPLDQVRFPSPRSWHGLNFAHSSSLTKIRSIPRNTEEKPKQRLPEPSCLAVSSPQGFSIFWQVTWLLHCQCFYSNYKKKYLIDIRQTY